MDTPVTFWRSRGPSTAFHLRGPELPNQVAARRACSHRELPATHRAAIGIRPAGDRYELPVVGVLFERQLKNTIGAVIASHAVWSRSSKGMEIFAARADYKGLRSPRVGLPCGVLRRKALIEMIVGLQNDVDLSGDEELDPRLDTLLGAVLARTGEVRLMPVGEHASIGVGVEVVPQPSRDVTDVASARSGASVRKRDKVPGPFVERVGRIRLKGDGALVAVRAATVEVPQWISVFPELIMVWRQDWIHLRNVRAPVLVEVPVVFRQPAVTVLIVAETQNEIRFGRLSGGGSSHRRRSFVVDITDRRHMHNRHRRRRRRGRPAELDGEDYQHQTDRKNELPLGRSTDKLFGHDCSSRLTLSKGSRRR